MCKESQTIIDEKKVLSVIEGGRWFDSQEHGLRSYFWNIDIVRLEVSRVALLWLRDFDGENLSSEEG